MTRAGCGTIRASCPQEDVAPAQAQAFAQYVGPTLLGVARRAVDLAELEDGQAVLDVATGTGLAAFLAAERVGPEGTVIGLDTLPGDARRGRGAGRWAPAADQIRWQEGDPARLELRRRVVRRRALPAGRSSTTPGRTPSWRSCAGCWWRAGGWC